WTTCSSKRCAPTNLTCTAPPPEPSGPAAILNEVFASPKADGGDANGDGISHPVEDEFVEIVNVTNKAVDLTGWRVADSFMTRFAFPPGTIVEPGKAVVVFGGGIESAFSSFDGASVFVSSNQLGLNNSGDRVTLTDKSGEVADEMKYGSEGGGGVSLVRSTDGDVSAPWILHPSRKHSAGLRTDGSPF
ncbi:MAG TPA: lamin tail domain-containing protein, partial [Polyangiaceae bacterium]|nr:lamin tail domain-containing protein [Polyangiaceae bacterium]